MSPSRDERRAEACHQIREVERFCYQELGNAVEPNDVLDARQILRLAVGLRRKLDLLRSK